MSNKYEVLIKNARVNAECGEHMSPTEVTTLLNVVETTFAALAAENAWLREYRPQPSGAAMMEALDAFYEYHEDVPEQGMMAAFEILCCKRPKIPATDTFLAEVRSQGVEMFASSLKVAGGGEHPYSTVANEFAAKLRQEAAQ
ncbi:hypothetical protein [Enterobacter roggenkampii]|uniref:hypothetical protein n=1 Tax=Enterobacter roggenkampii TaxID=1812935 RepID=UPI002076554B|nr:hypothetical protein [Enterobacter roggenkampii]MCM7636269.1 hypothetical protein [Enterobacter roggenkampii]